VGAAPKPALVALEAATSCCAIPRRCAPSQTHTLAMNAPFASFAGVSEPGHHPGGSASVRTGLNERVDDRLNRACGLVGFG